LTPLGAGDALTVWRLERTIYVQSWQTGEGAFLVGGRWSSAGRRVIYASMHPATAILEVAVHKTFDVLDSVPHTLLEIAISDASDIPIVELADIPNPNWLRPGVVSRNQQKFGDDLLTAHSMVAFPSVVAPHSLNLLVDVERAAGRFSLRGSEPFSLDTRLLMP